MRKRKFYSLLFSLGLFLTLNVPSVKIFNSSEIVNLLAFFMVWGIGIIRILVLDKGVIKLYRHKKIILFLFLLMWFVIFVVTLVKTPYNMSFRNYSEYFIVMLFFVGVLLFTKEEDVPSVLYLQIFWAAILSILTVTVGINLDRSLGQHYLTLGVPIGAGIVSSLSLILFKDKKISFNIWVILALIVSIIAISSLRGRTPLILSFVVPAIIGLLTLFFEKKLRLKVKKGILYSIFFVMIAWFFYNNLSDVWLSRISNLQNFQETEARYRVYSISVDIIKNNPLGIGLKNTVSYGIGYPHNIFLEIFISGGISAVVIFILIIALSIKTSIASIKRRSYAICASSISMFYFFTWNVSFDLSSSYIPFAALAIMIASVSSYRIGDEKNE